MENARRIAVLIDGDNAQASLASEILNEVSKHGRITTRRIYGDFTATSLNSWKKVIGENAISPHQQYAFSSGKNSTDSFMIIDAMDILHSGKVDGFAIASSDSDFSRLATRIREEGLFVMGLGRKNSTIEFQRACQVFVYTENLSPLPKPRDIVSPTSPLPKPRDIEGFREFVLRVIGSEGISSVVLGNKIIDFQKENNWEKTGKGATFAEFGLNKSLSYRASIEKLLPDDVEVTGENPNYYFRRIRRKEKNEIILGKEDTTKVSENSEESEQIDLSANSVPQLKEILRSRGLRVSGNKSELIGRIISEGALAYHNAPLKNEQVPVPEQDDPLEMMKKAIELASTDDDGWANLANIGEFLLLMDPAFDSRTFGHAKLSLLIKSIPEFEYRYGGGVAHARILPQNELV